MSSMSRGLLVFCVSLACSQAVLATELRLPTAKVDQVFTVSPQSYLSHTSVRGSLVTAQQEIALLLWKSNRELSADNIQIVGQQVSQQFRVAEMSGVSTLTWVDGVSQK